MIKITYLLTLLLPMVFTLRVFNISPKKNTSLLTEKKAEEACETYAAQMPTRLFPYANLDYYIPNGEFPHVVAILGRLNYTHLKFGCSGSLISHRYVLTSASAIQKIRPTVIRLGTVLTNEWQETEFDYTVEKVETHPGYKSPELYNDIALLRTSKDVTFSLAIQPICLYVNDLNPRVAMPLPGWGPENINDANNTNFRLSKISMTAIPFEQCKAAYRKTLQLPQGIISSIMCVTDKSGLSSVCQDNTGGALQYYDSGTGVYKAFGLLSFGNVCIVNSTIGITRISNYIDWIEKIVWL